MHLVAVEALVDLVVAIEAETVVFAKVEEDCEAEVCPSVWLATVVEDLRVDFVDEDLTAEDEARVVVSVNGVDDDLGVEEVAGVVERTDFVVLGRK